MIKTISIYTERRQYIYLEFISELSITPEALLCIICLKKLKTGKENSPTKFSLSGFSGEDGPGSISFLRNFYT